VASNHSRPSISDAAPNWTSVPAGSSAATAEPRSRATERRLHGVGRKPQGIGSVSVRPSGPRQKPEFHRHPEPADDRYEEEPQEMRRMIAVVQALDCNSKAGEQRSNGDYATSRPDNGREDRRGLAKSALV